MCRILILKDVLELIDHINIMIVTAFIPIPLYYVVSTKRVNGLPNRHPHIIN